MKYIKSFLLLIIFVSSPVWATKKTVVIWLSIDGMRADYLEKAQTPHFTKLINQGWFSRKLMPVFPSITFPSHVSQATGVKVQQHGISLNSFYDSARDELFTYPNDSALLQAEPIWQTVKRGGLRSAVLDWPLSFKQSGNLASDYFLSAYDTEQTDEQRINQLLKIWQEDTKQGKYLSLIMGYIVGPDRLGHELGPNDPKVFKVVEQVDALVGKIQQQIIQMAKGSYGKDYDFYLLITTDHGMLATTHAVNFHLLSRIDQNAEVKLITGGNIGHVFLNKSTTQDRQRWLAHLRQEYKKYPFLKFYEKSQLPQDWKYQHVSRVGDIVVVLKPGHIFSALAKKAVVPIHQLAGGPLGVHGYDPSISPEMKGLMVWWKYPETGRSVEIKGDIDSLQLHPTVSHLLGVAPSAEAKAKPIQSIIQGRR